MDVISQMITQQLSGAASQQIAARLGVSESTANTAVQVAVPLILARSPATLHSPKAPRNCIKPSPTTTTEAFWIT